VLLKWNTPSDPNYFYTKVMWTNAKGQPQIEQISVYASDPVTNTTELSAEGFANTETYEFTLVPCNRNGVQGEAVKISMAPFLPPLEAIVPTIAITDTDFGEATFEWTNNTGREVTIDIYYKNSAGNFETKSVASGTATTGATTLSGVHGGNAVEFTVNTRDKTGNKSEPRTLTATVLTEVKFDKSEWSIPGYDWEDLDTRDFRGTTIGASSQAADYEGAWPRGRVAAVYDGDTGKESFWHSSWGGPNTQLPQWFIVDLGSEKIISRIEVYKRYSVHTGTIGIQFETCTEAGTDYPGNTTNPTWDWEDQGYYPLTQTSAFDGVPQNYRLRNPRARYIRFYFPEESKGSSNYAQIGEITVYGADN